MFLLALAVRATAAVAFFLLSDGTLFGDDATYVRLIFDGASENDVLTNIDRRTLRYTGAFLYPLMALRAVVPSVVAMQLAVALTGAGAAAAIAGIARRHLGGRRALLAGGVVALLPSAVLFSSIVLKDALVWLLLPVVAITYDRFVRSREVPSSVVWALWTSGGLLTLLFVRQHSLIVLVWAIALLTIVARPRLHALKVGIAMVWLVAVPWIGRLGPAGLEHLASGSTEDRRARNASNASTAVVDRTRSGEDSVVDDLRYLPRGLTVVLLEPVPWRHGDLTVRLLQLEMALWYPMLALAAVGARRVLVTMRWSGTLLMLSAGGTLAVYALSEGNFGTASRHRIEVLGMVALGTVAGVQVIGDTWRRRRSDDPISGDA